MKRAASALAVACSVSVGWVAAPAVSTDRWRPKPLDFEVAPPAGAVLARAARGEGFVSKPLRAPKRFNLVGMRWRGDSEPRIAVRFRAAGGSWSSWAILPSHAEDAPDPARGERTPRGVSAPIWVGEADVVQYRMSSRVTGLRLHFVNVRGTATAGDRARTAVRRLANAAVGRAAITVGAEPARAQDDHPPITRREAWGAQGCRPRAAPEYGTVRAAFVHHTVTANDYTPEEAPDVVLAICRYHTRSNGWKDIGYNFLVDRFGKVYEGRAGGVDEPVVGAQAQGYNAQSTGIANLGTFTEARQSPEALDALAALLRWKLPLHGVPTSGRTTLVSAGGAASRYPAGSRVRVERISGHRDVDATSCPGRTLYAQLAELRASVGSVRPTRRATALTARGSPRRVRHGDPLTVRGRLRTSDGRPVGGGRIELQRRGRLGWRTARATTTDLRGVYRFKIRPRANRLLRAYFPGDTERLPSRSVAAFVEVRPVILVTAAPARAVPRVPVPIRGTVKPPRRRLALVLELRTGGRYRRLGARAVRARAGRFRTAFTPSSTGLYRFFVVAGADGHTAWSRSRPKLVRVARTAAP